jgi:hypothetical protein
MIVDEDKHSCNSFEARVNTAMKAWSTRDLCNDSFPETLAVSKGFAGGEPVRHSSALRSKMMDVSFVDMVAI